jgi:hypothetical protein
VELKRRNAARCRDKKASGERSPDTDQRIRAVPEWWVLP